MSTLRHFDNWGTARFITFSCHGRLPLLVYPGAPNMVLQELNVVRLKYRLEVYGYVIMPEHVHLVIFPQESVPLGRAIGEVKSKSAIRLIAKMKERGSPHLQALRVSRTNGAEYAFWLPRCYDHNCRDQANVLEKINYCHWNPVKRELVTKPEGWQWSSFGWYEGEAKCPLILDTLS